MNQIVIDPNQLSLTESQIAALVVDENVGNVKFNIEILRQFKLTNRIACKILCALCEFNQPGSRVSKGNSSSNGQQANNGPADAPVSNVASTLEQRSSQLDLIKSANQDNKFLAGRQNSPSCIEEIEIFAEYCRQNSINLQQFLQTYDDEGFISDRIFRNTNYALQPQKHSSVPPLAAFQRFWHFCTCLASSDKNGLSVVGRVFFTHVWRHNHEFQLNFIANCIEQNLISKILYQPPQQPATALQQQQNQWNLGQLLPYSELLKCQPDFEALPELHNWKYQRLYQILIDFTGPNSVPNLQLSTNCFVCVFKLFTWPLQYCPDLTVLGLLGCTGQALGVKAEVLAAAIPNFLNASHPNAAIVLHSIWGKDSQSASDPAASITQQKSSTPLTWSQNTLLQALSEHYTKSPPEEQQQRLSRILDVAQDIKTLFRLLDGTCYAFVIDLACLASRREYLKLDKWLLDKFNENGENFVQALILFLTKRYLPILSGNNKDSSTGALATGGPALPQETLAQMLTFLQEIVMPQNGQPVELSQAVKKEVCALIGNSAILLQRVPRQPPPGVANNVTSDYNRGDRLMNLPVDRPAMSEVENLQAVFDAKRMAQRAQRAAVPRNVPVGPSIARPAIGSSTNIEHLLALGSSGNYPVPPEVIQDKVFFIVNNLSLINLKQKAEEFKELFGDEDTYYEWTAHYFSTKRAAQEQNFQPLYANFLYELKNPKLIEAMTRETYKNIKHLLQIDKKADNIGDRTFLKNLGQWLGLLTLARNKPILHIDLDLKGLLVEAYHKGTQELLYVVPFLAEILKTTQKSKIFKPNNPFVLGLLRALVELRQQPNLKMNLEFQVEVLFNNLGVDLNKLVGQSNILNDEKYYSRIECQLGSKQISTQQSSQHQQPHIQQTIKTQLQQHGAAQQVAHSINVVMRPNDYGASLSPLNTPPLMSIGSTTNMSAQVRANLANNNVNNPADWYSKIKYSDLDVTNTANLSNLITLKSTLGLFNLQPNLQTVVKTAIENAISEWLPSILEKSLKICLPTVEQIVRKDFALDPDEMHMQRSAHSLVRHLVSYMSMMPCRDPEQVEQTIMTNLKVAFARAYPTLRKEQIDHAAMVITADNLELARAFIIKTTVERAQADIDKLLHNEYELRRNARLDGHQYIDPEHYAFHTKLVNDGMRIKPAPMIPEQMRNYDEIGQNIAGFKKFGLAFGDAGIRNTSPFGELGPNLNVQPIVNPTANLGKASPMGVANLGANMVNQLVSNRVITPNQFAAQQVPGFTGLAENPKTPTPHFNLADAPSMNYFDNFVSEIMPQLRQLAQTLPANLAAEVAQIAQCMQVLRSNLNDRNYKMLINKILDSMYELVFENGQTLEYNVLCRSKELHILLLRSLSETFGADPTTKQISRNAWQRFLTNIQDQKKSNGPEFFLELLMQNQLINMTTIDEHLVHLMTEAPMNPTLIVRFIHRFRSHFTENCLPKTVDLLIRLKALASQPFALDIQNCIESLQAPSRNQSSYLIPPTIGASNAFNNSASQLPAISTANNLLNQRETSEVGDPPGLIEKTERLLREWVSIHQTGQIVKMFPVFVQQMTAHGILKTDDLVTRFFRLSTEMCVESCYRLLATQPNGPNSLELRNKCYETLDAFTMLIVLLIKNSGSSSSSNLTPEPAAKINLLSKILSIIANVAIKDQETRQADFQHLAYYRILILLFIELNLSPPILGLPTQSFNNFNQLSTNVDVLAENVQFQVLNEFTKTLRTLRPSRVPSFAFAWLDFLSHRLFIEKCLFGYSANRPGSLYKGWSLYAQLLIDLIKFEAPFLRNVELPPSVDLLYKGTLKMFLVLLHDFPEFLCEYCYSLCDVIPCNAIQLRNLVLSAFPRKMRLPDPFTPNLKIDQLPEMSQPPKTGALQTNLINSVAFKDELDSYLRSRNPVTFLNNLTTYLRAQNQYLVNLSGGVGTINSLNVPLLNALVLYVGQSAITAIAPRSISMTTIGTTTHMDVFQHLATTLDTEGRYLFLNAIANQLRYPNSHTHYFSSALLYLFAVAPSEQIQEQITRVLVERLIIMRPHPWGLLVTFIELIKNPLFKFWKHEFVRCAPEIEKLFESVARSCCVQNTGAIQKRK